MSAAGAQGLGTGIAYPIEPPVFEPGVRATATYSDNLTLAGPGREKGDLLFEVSPYITARSNAPRASYSLFYQMRNFLRVREGDFTLMRHALDARGSFALIDDRFWLDATAYMGNVSTSPTGAIAPDPGASFGNTSSIRRFSLSPWYQDRLGDLATYQLRYSIAHNGGNGDFLVSKIEQNASAVVDGIPTSSRWNWRWHGEYQLRDYGNDLTRERRSSGAVLYYTVSPRLRVFGMIEYEQIEGLRNKDGDDFGYGPGVGFDWRPNARISMAASVSRRYYGTVGEARASYTRGHSTLGVNYSRSVLSSTDASLLLFDPMALTCGGLGSGMGGAANPIITNLASRGILLPPGLALSQSLVTDAAVLDRRLTAFYGLSGASNSLTFSGYLTNRTSAVETAATTTIPGIRGSLNEGGLFTGDLNQRGVIASLEHRLDARSSLNFTADQRRVSSPTAGFSSRFLILRAGYVTQLTSDTRAFAGMRHSRQRGENGSASYDENAIYAGVDVRFR